MRLGSLVVLVLTTAVLGCAAPAAVSPSPPAASPTSAATPPQEPTPADPTVAPATATPSPPPATAGTTPTEDGEARVTIIDFGFDPGALTIAPGTTVRWQNSGALPHTVTFEEGESSGVLDAGGSFSRAFESAGAFQYRCSIHPSMTGTINVGE